MADSFFIIMKPNRPFTLRDKFVLYFVIAGIIILGISGFISYYTFREAVLSRTFDQLTSIRIEKKKQIQAFLLKQEMYLREISFLKPLSIPVQLKGTANRIYEIKEFNPDSLLLIVNNDTLSNELINIGFIRKQLANKANGYYYFDYGSGVSNLEEQLYIIYKSNEKMLLASVSEKFISDIMFEVNPENGLGRCT